MPRSGLTRRYKTCFTGSVYNGLEGWTKVVCRKTIAALWVLVIGTGLAGTSLIAQTTPDEILRIVKKIDELHRSKSSYAEFDMKIVTPHWTRTLDLEAWSVGMDKTFIRIRAPKKEKGVSTLRVEGEMWNYLPKTSKIIKVPPSMMMGSWMGSDFTNDDLVKEFSLLEDYSYERAYPDDAVDSLIYIRATPREDLPVVWGEILVAVSASDSIPVWEQYYDEKGRPLRRMSYYDMTIFSGRKVPATMEMVPQTKDGHKTVLHYKTLELDIPIDDDIFSLRNLRADD